MAIKIYKRHIRFKLEKINIRIIGDDENEEWNNLIETHHYRKPIMIALNKY